jgi:uncharacterized protein (DUF488 family)
MAEADSAPEAVRNSIAEAVRRFGGKDVKEYVYGHYPRYTVRSKLVEKPKEKGLPGLYTIGYEGKDIDLFLDSLIQNGIEEVIDVRANPFSISFQFIGKGLKRSLENSGIGYTHIPELGIPGENRKGLSNAEDYEKLFAFYKSGILPGKEEKLRMLADLAGKKRIALLCFEADKGCCHRGVLSAELERIIGKKAEHL